MTAPSVAPNISTHNMTAKVIMQVISSSPNTTILSQMTAINSVIEASGITVENMEDEQYQQEISALRLFLQQPKIITYIKQELEHDNNTIHPIILQLSVLTKHVVPQISAEVHQQINQ